MDSKHPKLGFVFLLLAFLLILAFVIVQQTFVTSVKAQSPGCVNQQTGAACTNTPPPQCGLPGVPACVRPPNQRATDTPIPPPTRTPTQTHTPSITPSPTNTITLIPTVTWYPSPTPKPFNYVAKSIPNFLGLVHIPDSISAPLPSWLQPDNIQVTDVEITQAVQCLHDPNCSDNSVALYQGKATLVRVYVRLTTGPDSFVYPIGGALCYGNTGAKGCLNPLRPVNKIFVQNVKDPVSYGRAVMGTTLNFILPLSYVESPVTQTLTVYANYNFEDLPQENYYKDNYKVIQYQVQTSQPIYIRYYPVQDNGYFPPPLAWATINDYISKTYPTNEVYPSIGFPLYGKNYDWTTADPWGCPKGWHDLINDLWTMRSGDGPVAFGEVPYQSIVGGVIGCGVLGGPEAAGLAGTSRDGRVAAQEVGHTMNLPHVPGCGAGGADMNYPEPNGLLDEFGADVYLLQVYPSSSSYDFMGYCGGGGNTWTSIYTYNEIAGLLPEGAFHPSGSRAANLSRIALQPQLFLMGTGDLNPTSARLTQGFFLLEKNSVNEATPDKGPYTIELHDLNGKTLYSQHFDLAQMSNDEPQTQGGFQLVIPWADGTHRVVFKYQDQVIGQVAASAHAPVVSLTSPKGGEHWAASGQQTIAWTASDADRNPLSYLVQYSPDGGKTWEMLANNLQATSFSFDTQYLPGSAQGQVRVVATDGLNTTIAASQALTVDPKPPLLFIASPQDGAAFDYGSPVVLHGIGSDLLDGPISADKLQWTSDRDGNLGSGDTIVNQKLSVGEHIISLSATNSSGLTSTVTIHIKINPPAKLQSVGGNSYFQDFLVPGILVLLVAGVVLAVIFAFRKKGARSKPS